MKAVEWLFENSKINGDILDNRNQIIRAVNYSIMNIEKLREQAIKERRTIGEVYYDKIIKTK
jgi:hypothetical protein